MSTYQISKIIKVSERRINQILKIHRETGELPVVGKSVGRPKKNFSPEEEQAILDCYDKYKVSASPLSVLSTDICRKLK